MLQNIQTQAHVNPHESTRTRTTPYTNVNKTAASVHTQHARTHLAIRVFDGGYVGLPEGALDEAQDQGGLADASSPEHHHAVVVTLFRHLLTPAERGRA